MDMKAYLAVPYVTLHLEMLIDILHIFIYLLWTD